jgi:hypothetical protein
METRVNIPVTVLIDNRLKVEIPLLIHDLFGPAMLAAGLGAQHNIRSVFCVQKAEHAVHQIVIALAGKHRVTLFNLPPVRAVIGIVFLSATK